MESVLQVEKVLAHTDWFGKDIETVDFVDKRMAVFDLSRVVMAAMAAKAAKAAMAEKVELIANMHTDRNCFAYSNTLDSVGFVRSFCKVEHWMMN